MTAHHHTGVQCGSESTRNGSFNSDDSDRPQWQHDTVLESRFEYRNADGSHAYYVERGRNPDGAKVFRIRRANLIPFSQRLEPEEKVEEFTGKAADQPWVLYRLPELISAAADQFVFLVEGEKDVETLVRLGLVATTNPCGALKWRPEFSECLVGRDVVILPDNDDRGRQHAAKVLGSIFGKARSVRVVNLPGLRPSGDVTDWLEAGGKL